MPVSVGFHPYFQLTDSPRDEWTISVGARTHLKLTPNKLPTGETEALPAPFTGGVPLRDYELDDSFMDLVRDEQGRATMTVSGKTQRLDVHFGPNYRAAQVWSVITPLDPGNYRVSAEISGFQTAVREGLTLTVGQAARVELTLSLGGLSTEVQVVAETPTLNTESATLSQVITNEQIVDLPLNGRGFYELARLTSGVALLPPTGNTQPVRPEVANGNVIGGVAGAQTRFLLDGVDITEEHQGGTWIQTSVDALQEFSVQQNAYSAEFHGAGATFNVTTKSGGNTFHGSLFEFTPQRRVRLEKLLRGEQGKAHAQSVRRDARRSGDDSRNVRREKQDLLLCQLRRAPAPARCHRRQHRAFGGAAPGRFQRPRADIRPASTTTVAGVATRTQFANNQIPANRISPQAQFFMKYIPLPNAPGNTYMANPLTEFNQNQMTLRYSIRRSTRRTDFLRASAGM